MHRARWIILTSVSSLLAFAALSGLEWARDTAWKQRIGVLRRLSAPAAERIAHGPELDDLRAKLEELDGRLQLLSPPDRGPAAHALTAAALSLDLAPYREWVAHALPALQPWLRTELCGTPPSDAPSQSDGWIPLRDRVTAKWVRGERVAKSAPYLASQRNFANLLAWHAYFESGAAADAREDWELSPAEILASIFPLAFAYDDSSAMGTLVRVSIETQTIGAACALLDRRVLSAHELRGALDAALARSSVMRFCDIVEGELHASLAFHDRTAEDARAPARELLEHYANAERAIEAAERPYAIPADIASAARAGDEMTFEDACSRVLATARRHRSVLVLARIAFALAEHHEKHGAYPERLEALAPLFPKGMPSDPVTGDLFSYRVIDGRAELGPAACPEHGNATCADSAWSTALDRNLAWELAR